MTIPRSPENHSRILALLAWGCIVLAFLGVLFLTFFPIQDNDIWWILASGREIVRTKSLLSKDVFSFTIPGSLWVNKYHVFEVLAYLLFEKAGPDALIALRSFLVLLCLSLIILVGFVLRKAEQKPPPSLLFISAIFAIMGVLLAPRMFERPELFSFLCFSGMLLLWESRRKRNITPGFVACLLLLQTAWVNLHGAFILGWPIAILYLLERLLQTRGKSWKEGFILIPLFLVSFVNPYGYKLFYGVFDVVEKPFHQKHLVEWHPLFFPDQPEPFRWIISGIAILTFLGFVLNRGERRWIHFVFTLLFFLMTLRSRRHSGFFALTIGMANLWNYSVVFDSIKHRLKKLPALSVSLALTGIVILVVFNLSLVSGAFFRMIGVSRPFGFGIQKSRYPWDSALFMRERMIKGNLFSGYDMAGFLIWELYPQVKTCVDGRAEPFPSDLLETHWRIIVGEEPPMPFCEKYEIVLSLIDFDDRHLLKIFRQDQSWALCHIGIRAALFLKRTPQNNSIIEQYEIPKEENRVTDEIRTRLLLPPPEILNRQISYADYAQLSRIRIRMLEDLGLPKTAEIQRKKYLENIKR